MTAVGQMCAWFGGNSITARRLLLFHQPASPSLRCVAPAVKTTDNEPTHGMSHRDVLDTGLICQHLSDLLSMTRARVEG